MRIQLARSGDEGAVAVIVALLAVVIIGIAAFTTDFGASYAAKRELQNSADAASLAAAKQFALTGGTCATLTSNTALMNSAEAAADNYRESNRAGSTQDEYVVECNADGNLEVSYTAGGVSPRLLGAIFGASDYDLGRTATAVVEPSEGGTGLRPYAVCNRDLPPQNADGTYQTPSGVFKLDFTNSACQKPAGDWWTVLCPEDATPSIPVLAENTRNGCEGRIRIVPDQPDTDPPLRAHLMAHCATGFSESCLRGDPGVFSSSQIRSAWQSLIGKTITLPVFLDNTIRDPATNAVYPVYRLIGVRICGYHWGASAANGSYAPATPDTTGPCSGPGMDASAGGATARYLLVNWVYVLTTGDTSPTTCGSGLGSDCDTVRRIRLVQ